ncbi:hypothetical protein, partial [Nocardia puris]|uniref:hypothetical protein n=1 Tax=Nocardia puris TaxID=208602 RepID=UPI0018DE8E96
RWAVRRARSWSSGAGASAAVRVSRIAVFIGQTSVWMLWGWLEGVAFDHLFEELMFEFLPRATDNVSGKRPTCVEQMFDPGPGPD